MTPREMILASAARLFQLKGYNATGLNEIVSESGAPKGSLYYYFPRGKLQLGIEAVAYAGSSINAHVGARLSEEPDPVKAFQRVIHDIMEHFKGREAGFKDVSLSIVALEASNEAESLQRACETVFRERESLFAEKLSAAGFPKTDARRLGALMQILIEGAIIATRTRNDTAPLGAVSSYIPALLAR